VRNNFSQKFKDHIISSLVKKYDHGYDKNFIYNFIQIDEDFISNLGSKFSPKKSKENDSPNRPPQLYNQALKEIFTGMKIYSKFREINIS